MYEYVWILAMSRILLVQVIMVPPSLNIGSKTVFAPVFTNNKPGIGIKDFSLLTVTCNGGTYLQWHNSDATIKKLQTSVSPFYRIESDGTVSFTKSSDVP